MTAYKSFAVTAQGNSHIKEGKDCQDASCKYDSPGVVIAVAADGHGDDNCFRSAAGAKFAVACASTGMREFVRYLNQPDPNEPKQGFFKKPLSQKNGLSKEELSVIVRERLIKRGIIPAWFNLVQKDLAKNPITETELQKTSEKYRGKYLAGQDLHHAYGTTLIAAAITEDYFFGIHIGDGRFTVLYKDGTFDQPVPWDERCYLNVTTSICDDDAAETSRIYFCPKTEKPLPAAVFLCTDGIDDNYPVDGNERHLFKLYRTIALTFAEEGFDSTCGQLWDLANSFATKGKGDDTSIAGFIDITALKQTVPIWKSQIAGEESEKAARQKSAVQTQPPVTEAAPAASKKAAKETGLDYGDFVTKLLSTE